VIYPGGKIKKIFRVVLLQLATYPSEKCKGFQSGLTIIGDVPMWKMQKKFKVVSL
jgi:hypothetical protein